MTERVFEMLWDCEFCSAKKLLGKTHRYCPRCGAPQNPQKRYFPSDADKVEAKDHEYHGADKLCLACKTANSAKTKFCVACGGSMAEGKTVPLVSGGGAVGPAKEVLAEVDAREEARKSARRRLIAKVAAGCAGLVLLLLVVLAATSKEVELSVAGRLWEREIDIEAFRTVKESSWCDSMPVDSYDVSRSREVRSHDSVADGEDCRTVRRDRGDGTYSEEEECTTRYRDEPVYDDMCRYSVDRWARQRSEVARGALSEPPAWPEARLSRTGQCQGCEREGARKERYTVNLQGGGKTHSCAFAQDRWGSFAAGSRWKGRVNALTGLDCRKLEALK
ncbi:MAG: zinc ribbon domain-containing protein [Elusimicrobia bacterium]|nr:zinc ribbon domain-containing protein [Elusimicrobiota bacterium]